MHEELNQFVRNDVWKLTPRLENVHVIGTKWIFKNKTDEDGEIIRNKSWLVAQGYTQVEGVDFDESFAFVARLESYVHCMHYELPTLPNGCKCAFLNGYLNEEVFVEQPKGFEDPHFPDHVLRLKKALYGLKQAPRAWYDRLTHYHLNRGFKKGYANRILFVKNDENYLLAAQVYVDDIVFGATIDDQAIEISEKMKKEFDISMVGELTFFLGLQVKQKKEDIFISREKYARNIVKKFGLDSKKHASTPMSSSTKLNVDSSSPTLYRSIIVSLLYLIASRPDIAFSVGVCARYQAAPKESHLIAVKQIIRYINGTPDYGLWYSKDSNACFAGYSDVDWVGSVDDQKSTSGGYYLGNNLVLWISKKQNFVSLSTAEAEYIATGSCCTQLLWMKKLLHDYGIP